MKKKIKRSKENLFFDIFINVVIALFVLAVLYPLYFVVIASFSDPTYVNRGDFLLYPKGFNLLGYELVFREKSIWIGYINTIFYTVSGTALGVICVLMAGYALSRKDLVGSGLLMKLLVFTMYFGGGTIPVYMTIKNYNLLDTRLLMVILGSISVYNIIVVRSFMQGTIPDELLDAASIDGCGNGRFFFGIVVPLSKAVIAVIALYIAVVYWNSYFNAMIYMMDENKYPLQLFLREILLMSSNLSNSDIGLSNPAAAEQLELMTMVMKYSVIVVSTVPILCVYPFIQKYFVKGVMIGAVKG